MRAKSKQVVNDTRRMELAVIILNWNAATDTVRCVRSVASWRSLKPTIWVVDNCSHDGSAEDISAECPAAHMIRNPANLGFAGGNNRGIAQALAVSESPIFLLNNDARIEETDVISLLNTLRSDEHIGFVGPLLYDADRPDILLSAGARDPALHHQSHILTLTPGGPVRIVECVPGTAILVRAEVFHAVGLLDEAYFFASEIADVCMRARARGYLSVIDTRARVYHSLGRSSLRRETLHTYYIIRNRFLLVRKFHRRWLVPLSAFWSMYSIALWLRIRLAGRRPAARAVWLGLVDGLRGRYGGQNESVLSIGNAATSANGSPVRSQRGRQSPTSQ
jgi:GT2 family glycosyltransferase